VPCEPTDSSTISFSLWTVVAEHTRKTPGSSLSSCRERMHPPSTDGLSAQVALLQSLILSAVAIDYPFDDTMTSKTKAIN